ncbi:MAG: 2-amino-4-hydroxy-6-hydroxymethyldihydropteridine diphosphokinase [Verrucomicrobia bacterium]|nr:2-amino-4-hydroxy-6-hydroxymethyldihydropteridine diphosphokinase [Verrucomicrobiota bacterium]MBI3868016.1 2-amino-4-hydroxy-6-hydroxymethyldihydropteridine diphosphokinase [Verrucomicrobiota bacterium]
MAVVALGSNLGRSRAVLSLAVKRLRKLSASPLRCSSVWSTAPVDCPPGSPDFLNAVVALEPFRDETPESLLKKLQALEREFGRRPKKVLNEPRPLDLDLILFGRERRDSALLRLPHPRALARIFVLGPLCEVAPDLVFPGRRLNVRTFLERLQSRAGSEPRR